MLVNRLMQDRAGTVVPSSGPGVRSRAWTSLACSATQGRLHFPVKMHLLWSVLGMVPPVQGLHIAERHGAPAFAWILVLSHGLQVRVLMFPW